MPIPDTRPPEPVSWLIALLIIALPIFFARWGKTRPNLFIKVGGVSGILAGLTLLISYWVFDANPDQEWLQILLLTFMAISFVSMTFLKRRSKFLTSILWITAFGAILTAEAFIISVWLRQDEIWMILLVGAFLLFAGLLIFGITNLKVRIFSSLNWIPLLTVLLGVISPLLLGNFSTLGINLPTLLYFNMLGSGFAIMGILLLLNKEQ